MRRLAAPDIAPTEEPEQSSEVQRRALALDNTDSATHPDAAADPPQTDRFEILAYLGQGGMGTVYRALDREFGQEVALKTVRTQSPIALTQLKAEFRARAQVHHANLLPLFDLIVTGAQAFFSMQLVDTVGLLPWVWGSQYDSPAGGGQPASGQPSTLALQGQLRLAAVMTQVIEALCALHDAGFVHRDVKPDNLLIDQNGHVFLADFGLMTSLVHPSISPTRTLHVAGTPLYMAPEQQFGAPSTAASDLYAAGITLIEGLTGSAPMPAGFGERKWSAPHAAELARLASALTRRQPEGRPPAREVLKALHRYQGTEPGAVIRAPALRELDLQAAFVGRHDEVADMLGSWHAAEGGGRMLLIHVSGPSGIGKTTLLRRVLRMRQASTQSLVLFEGRCHPHERVDYCAFDGVVDGLADYLGSLDRSLLDVLDQAGLEALGALFPVLRPLARTKREPSPDADRRQLRLRAFAALRQLLAQLAALRPIALWIDDLHWADDDSVELLSALLSGSGISGCTVVLSYQSTQAAKTSLAALRAMEGEEHSDKSVLVHRLELPPLAPEDMQRLLAVTLDPTMFAEAELVELARGSEGYPIFARLLSPQSGVHRATIEAQPQELGVRLSLLINSRIDSLSPEQQRFVDAVAVAAGPVPLAVVSRVAQVEASPLSVLTGLEQAGLVRRSPHAAVRRVSLSHDRLRDARLQRLSPLAQVELHAAFTSAHEQLHTQDYEALFHHYAGAGDHGRAGEYAVHTGDRASAALAFASAAEYYAQALSLLPCDSDRWRLEEKLATAYANDGRGAVAAPQFERAATSLAESSGTEAAVNRLLVRAAEQYFRSGWIADGYRVMRRVLAALNTHVPRNRLGALIETVWLRLGFVLRGVPEIDVHAVRDDREDLQLDALWTASTSLAHVNHALAAVLLLRYMKRASNAGEPARLARSLTYAGGGEAALGGRSCDRRCDRMLAAAEPWIRDHGNDYDRGWYWVSRAAVHFFRAQWPDVIRCAETAAGHLAAHKVGVAWELGVNELYHLSALALVGDVAKLALRQPLALEQARSRGDTLAEDQCRSGHAATLWLYEDDLATARREVARSLNLQRSDAVPPPSAAGWPEDGFSTCDYQRLLAATQLALYEGDPYTAYARVAGAWPRLRQALLLHVRSVGIELRYLLGRSALAASADPRAVRAPADWPRAWNARALERVAAGQAERLRRMRGVCSKSYAELLQAALDRRRDRAEAEIRLRSACDGFDRLSMTAHAQTARYRLGELARGADRTSRCAEARDALAELGVRAPERIVDLFAPA